VKTDHLSTIGCAPGISRSSIWVNEPTRVFIVRDGIHELSTTLLGADEVFDLVEKMLESSGRR
jgi:pilus assembly protein CpaF